MTLVQKWEEKGKIEGKVEGKVEVAKQLLNERSDLNETALIEWINRVTGLPIEKIRGLRYICL